MIGNQYEYEAMAKCERGLWWYRCLHDLTLRKIKRNKTIANPRVLDAGCGTGGLLLYLKQHGYADIDGFDLSPDAVAYARAKTGMDIKLYDITAVDNAYPQNHFDIVINHDILCLLKEGQDKMVLLKLLAVLKPGGLLLMNFPALKAFKGTHDMVLDIQRRYSRKALEKMVGGSAVIKEITYWPFFLSPAIFITRAIQKTKYYFIKSDKLVSDVKMPPALLNRIFYKLTRMENMNIKRKPWGSSLFMVLQKPI